MSAPAAWSGSEARELDEKTLKVYLGHPHLRIFDNGTDFPRKIERVLPRARAARLPPRRPCHAPVRSKNEMG